MKKVQKVVAGAVALLSGLGFMACDGEKNVMVISREAGSGTRSAFEEIVKKDGVKLQDATLLDEVEIVSTTGAVISKVETNKTAIGYVSFSSVSDSVKTLKINGVEATADNVQNGSYPIKRPFLLLTSTQYALSPVAQDFYNYCMSVESKDEIEREGCIETNREEFTYTTTAASITGTVKLEGSTSMTDIMTALIGEYKKVQPNVTVEATYNGSSNGRSAVQKDTSGNTIGLASASKADAAYVEHTLCLDAIAVIVNKACVVENIRVEALFDIYTGTITKFSTISD